LHGRPLLAFQDSNSRLKHFTKFNPEISFSKVILIYCYRMLDMIKVLYLRRLHLYI